MARNKYLIPLILLVGDLLALVLFVYVGQRDHDLVNEAYPMLGVLITSIMFAGPWVLTGWLLGAFPSRETLSARSLLARTLNAWLVTALLCAIVELQTLTGSPQNFTLRLNQSSTASLSWTEPPGGGQDGYLLVALGGSTQSLGGAVTNAGVPMSGPTCYLLGAIRSGALMDNTGVVCGLPGFSNLGS